MNKSKATFSKRISVRTRNPQNIQTNHATDIETGVQQHHLISLPCLVLLLCNPPSKKNTKGLFSTFILFNQQSLEIHYLFYKGDNVLLLKILVKTVLDKSLGL